MKTAPNRRQFIEIVPFVSLAFVAACSPKVEPPVVAVPTPPAPVAPVATVAPAPSAAPMPPAAADAAPAVAKALPFVEEKDAQALALGYVADNARADKAKFASYVAGNQCSGCVLYLGKAGDAAGPCPLFAGKQVTAIGWCNSWVKKA